MDIKIGDIIETLREKELRVDDIIEREGLKYYKIGPDEWISEECIIKLRKVIRASYSEMPWE